VKTYPIMLNLQGRSAVVVGGGHVGIRKARALAEAGAKVTLLTEAASTSCDCPPAVQVRPGPYEARLLAGADIVMACTADRATNARIAADARQAGALVNVADQSEDCDFFLPAVSRDGPVVIAVGTNGTSPALAMRLRDELAEALPEKIGRFATLLGRIRKTAKARVADEHARGDLMRRLSEKQTYDLFIAHGEKSVLELADQLIAAIES